MENREYSINAAIAELETINLKNGGDFIMLNGNFSFVAKKFKLKVATVREFWGKKYPKKPYVKKVYPKKMLNCKN